ncbi:hypothetical protein H4W80_004418 [Nonomuraea angiospora]|uniref:Uncharacterized protein n=1 Tax=Nonomuraea angiospora TaxID=46172 RepID=A0ABR9LZT2_9ACTN|nr:hypothetical protein [Nonomuraea angiospora]
MTFAKGDHVGRHAKPHSPKDELPEPQEDSTEDEIHTSRGKHAKDRQPSQ